MILKNNLILYYNIMYSNKIVHDELDEVMCPFCYEQMNERLVITKNYFDKQWLENKDHVIFCINCGQVDGYQPMKEFCSFQNDKCKIVRKSRYFRIYYLNKVIFNLTNRYDIKITTKNRKQDNSSLSRDKQCITTH